VFLDAPVNDLNKSLEEVISDETMSILANQTSSNKYVSIVRKQLAMENLNCIFYSPNIWF
jgi:hypothetical protein